MNLQDTSIDSLSPYCVFDEERLYREFDEFLDSQELLDFLKTQASHMIETISKLDVVPSSIRLFGHKLANSDYEAVLQSNKGLHRLGKVDISAIFYFEDLDQIKTTKNITDGFDEGIEGIHGDSSISARMRMFAYDFFIFSKAKEAMFESLPNECHQILDKIFQETILTRSHTLQEYEKYTNVNMTHIISGEKIRIISLANIPIQKERTSLRMHLKGCIHELLHQCIDEFTRLGTPLVYRSQIYPSSPYFIDRGSLRPSVYKVLDEACTKYLDDLITSEIYPNYIDKSSGIIHMVANSIKELLASKNLELASLIRLINDIQEELNQEKVDIWLTLNEDPYYDNYDNSDYCRALNIIKKVISNFNPV